jgi:hypothetical protein
MLARCATRVSMTAAFAGKRTTPATFRYNSSSSSSGAARVMQFASQAERPSKFHSASPLYPRRYANHSTGAGEAAVPVMWAACGVLAYTAWSRMDERTVGDSVEKLLVI